MAAKTNSLKVRRMDLLEQLEERYAWMTKEKEKYEKQEAIYNALCDEYQKEVDRWEARIPDFLEGAVRGLEVDVRYRPGGYSRYSMYRSSDEWSANVSVSFTREELQKYIGPEPTRPEGPERPSFLKERYGYKYNQPSIYQSVYQALQLLHMSDDEHVSASMYQAALEAL